ncbi:sigma 54-interacting transcriptional regulator [Pseudomonas aeruginosa]
MSRQKALIVDDEPDIRELLEITLGRMKLDTRSARNVKEARELLAREPFDLCLTDMRLPDGSGGTLFLDEVADLPMAMQVKLLRAIQEKAVRAVGGQQEVAVDVRILCATHKDLAAEVGAGRFRQDLYYRLNVIELRVPPLRERREDIPLLAERILKRLAGDTGLPAARLTGDAQEKLKNYRFPGNVRELENMLERAYTLCEDDQIQPHDLRLADAPGASQEGAASLSEIDNLEDYLEDIERKLIMQALEETRWNRTAAAQRLGLTFRSMRYRLKKLGID